MYRYDYAPRLFDLLKLLAQAHERVGSGAAPEVSLAELSERSGGLILLTGGADGPLGRLLQEGEARQVLRHLASLWGYDVVLREVDPSNGAVLREHAVSPPG